MPCLVIYLLRVVNGAQLTLFPRLILNQFARTLTRRRLFLHSRIVAYDKVLWIDLNVRKLSVRGTLVSLTKRIHIILVLTFLTAKQSFSAFCNHTS